MKNLAKNSVIISAVLLLIGGVAIGEESTEKFVGVPVALESLYDEVIPAVNEQSGESDGEGRWLIAMAEFADTAETANAVPAAKAEGWQKPIPIGLYLDYTMATDYIWRGINLSEYRGEGREKLNHQLTAGINYDTGDFGTIDFSVWFEWYGANDKVGSPGDDNLQEVDYTFSWTYDLLLWLDNAGESAILLKFDRMYVDSIHRVRWVLSSDGTSHGIVRV